MVCTLSADKKWCRGSDLGKPKRTHKRRGTSACWVGLSLHKRKTFLNHHNTRVTASFAIAVHSQRTTTFQFQFQFQFQTVVTTLSLRGRKLVIFSDVCALWFSAHTLYTYLHTITPFYAFSFLIYANKALAPFIWIIEILCTSQYITSNVDVTTQWPGDSGIKGTKS